MTRVFVVLRSLLRLGGILAAVTAAGAPVAVDQAAASGEPLVLVLDVSPSMRAADVAPDRLTEARRQVRDAVAAHPPARAGVVVFAGDARVLCPPTADLRAVQDAVALADAGEAPPGGSSLALALERAALTAGGRGHVVLLTDGEAGPAPEPDPEPLARRLAGQGLRLTVVGVGTPGGAPLPAGAGASSPPVEVHHSRLDDDRLRRVAAAANGRYVTLSEGGRLDLGPEAPAVPTAQWPVRGVAMLAFALLCADACLWWLRPGSNPWA